MPRRAALRLAAILLLAQPAAAFAREADGAAPAGRDATGGVELLLRADGADLGRTRAAIMQDTIERAMAAEGIAIASLSAANGRLSFRVRDPAQAGRALEQARRQSGSPGAAAEWDVRLAPGDRIAMRETRAGHALALRQRMEAAREVIEHRIRGLGAGEAIVLDDKIIAAPTIHEPILGGTAQISGTFTVESAGRFAAWLQSGALPIAMIVIRERRLAR
jgi:preprotein translocase subunit SecD